MLERVCRACQAGNPLDTKQCTECGTPFETTALTAQPQITSLRQRIEKIPIFRSKKARSVALGLTAVAIEVGTTLLKRHAQGQHIEQTQNSQAQPLAQHFKRKMVRQRVWEHFDSAGNLRSRVVENLIVRDE